MLYMHSHKQDCPFELLGTVTVGPKGQVVIPVEGREHLSLEPGDKMVALYVKKNQAIALLPTAQVETMLAKMNSHRHALESLLQNTK